MSKWRYLSAQIDDADMDERLNNLGNEGWELVTAQPVWFHEFWRDNFGDIDSTKPPMVTLSAWKCVFKKKA